MSAEERARRNLPRFSWEVTIADVIQLLVLVAMAVKLYDQVQEHETRIIGLEAQNKTLAQSTGDQDRRLAVLEDRGERYHGPVESHGNGGK